jgi:ribosomal protein L30/L7E
MSVMEFFEIVNFVVFLVVLSRYIYKRWDAREVRKITGDGTRLLYVRRKMWWRNKAEKLRNVFKRGVPLRSSKGEQAKAERTIILLGVEETNSRLFVKEDGKWTYPMVKDIQGYLGEKAPGYTDYVTDRSDDKAVLVTARVDRLPDLGDEFLWVQETDFAGVVAATVGRLDLPSDASDEAKALFESVSQVVVDLQTQRK